MKRVKIVKEFFGIAAAKAQATWQRVKAKKDGRQIHKIEIVPAYELFKTNGWFKNNPFKKIGIPSPEQYMVIVHFEPETPVSAIIKKVETIVTRAKRSPQISTVLHVFSRVLVVPFYLNTTKSHSFRSSCSRLITPKAA